MSEELEEDKVREPVRMRSEGRAERGGGRARTVAGTGGGEEEEEEQEEDEAGERGDEERERGEDEAGEREGRMRRERGMMRMRTREEKSHLCVRFLEKADRRQSAAARSRWGEALLLRVCTLGKEGQRRRRGGEEGGEEERGQGPGGGGNEGRRREGTLWGVLLGAGTRWSSDLH